MKLNIVRPVTVTGVTRTAMGTFMVDTDCLLGGTPARWEARAVISGESFVVSSVGIVIISLFSFSVLLLLLLLCVCGAVAVAVVVSLAVPFFPVDFPFLSLSTEIASIFTNGPFFFVLDMK